MSSNKLLASVLVVVLILAALPVSVLAGDEPAPWESDPAAVDLEDAEGYRYFAKAALEEAQGPPAPALDLERFRGNTPIEQMLNATKAQIRQLDRQCQQARRANRDPSRACELSIVNKTCAARSQDLRARADFLRKFVHPGGDDRRWLTKVGYRISRDLRQAWYRIGPIGRRILRPIGDEIKDSVMSGYIPKAGQLKRLAQRSLIRGARREGLRLTGQAFDRLIERAAGAARAEGVGVCGDEQDQKVAKPSLTEGTGTILVDSVIKAPRAYANITWAQFQDGVCPFYQTANPTFGHEDLPGLKVRLELDLVVGVFSGVIAGETYFKEWSTEAWGDFRLQVTEGRLTRNESGHGWTLKGTGAAAIGYAQTASCWTSPDDSTPVVRTQRGSGGAIVPIEGRIDLINDDYVLSLLAAEGGTPKAADGTLDYSQQKEFRVGLADIVVGTYEPEV